MNMKKYSWQVTINTSNTALGRCMNALISTRSTLHCHTNFLPRLGDGIKAKIAIKIPEGQEGTFRAICRPLEMGPPPGLRVGDTTTGNPEHPGRKDPAKWSTSSNDKVESEGRKQRDEDREGS